MLKLLKAHLKALLKLLFYYDDSAFVNKFFL